MNNITIRNIPDKIKKRLVKRAEASHRSLNNEIIACLEEAVLPNKTEIKRLLERSDQIREKLNFKINEEEINQAKRSGRK